MGYLMMVSERSHHKDVKGEKIFQIYLSIQKIQRFESSVFRHFVTKNSTNGRKFKFKNAISFEWIGIFQIFFTFDIPVVTSFRDHHQISHNTKNKIWRELCDVIFPQNLKNKKHTFFWNSKLYIVTKFQVNCVKTKKDE